MASANTPPTPAPLPSGKEPALRLLVLDDLQFDRLLVRRVCERMGMDLVIDEANSLRELAHRLTRRTYDLILIDHWLPDGDGLTALRMVQDNPENCHTITIIVTRDANPSLASAALKRGCSDYFEKDLLSPQALQSAIERATRLRRKTMPSDAAALPGPPSAPQGPPDKARPQAGRTKQMWPVRHPPANDPDHTAPLE